MPLPTSEMLYLVMEFYSTNKTKCVLFFLIPLEISCKYRYKKCFMNQPDFHHRPESNDSRGTVYFLVIGFFKKENWRKWYKPPLLPSLSNPSHKQLLLSVFSKTPGKLSLEQRKADISNKTMPLTVPMDNEAIVKNDSLCKHSWISEFLDKLYLMRIIFWELLSLCQTQWKLRDLN